MEVPWAIFCKETAFKIAEHRFLAWCGHAVDLNDLSEIEPVFSLSGHYEFGCTPQEAVAKLRRKVLQ